MALDFEGPWHVRDLIADPLCPVPDKGGTYLVSIPRGKHDPVRHRSSEFIYIGGMGASRNASLSKRLGEFVAAAFGFQTYHSGGLYFRKTMDKHKINPWDLALWWCPCPDPVCCEVELFALFADAHGKDLPLLNRNRRRSRCGKAHEPLELVVPWCIPRPGVS
jgi:hypothetical protein